MKITRVRTDVVSMNRCNAIFVRIDTDNDLVGLGETVIKRRDFTVRQNIDEMAAFLIGRDPLMIEDIAEKLYRDSFWVGGALHAAGRSAVDMALWDIKGQYYRAPIYDLLGGLTRPNVLTYCHCAAGSSPAEFAAEPAGLPGARLSSRQDHAAAVLRRRRPTRRSSAPATRACRAAWTVRSRKRSTCRRRLRRHRRFFRRRARGGRAATSSCCWTATAG